MLATETPTLPTERRRSEQTIREQCALIVAFLRGHLSDDDRAAVASRGWRPVSWNPDAGPCAAEDCRTKHDHSPHDRNTPRWQAEIDHAIDAWPKYLLIGVPVALAQLSKLDREIVFWVAEKYQSYSATARMVRVTDKTVRAHYDAALECVCRAVWSEDGTPNYA